MPVRSTARPRLRHAALATLATTLGTTAVLPAQTDAERRMVVSVHQVWEAAPHNAFTDLVRYGGYLWCAFREGTGHVPGIHGVVRVIRGRLDGTQWEPVQLIAEEGVDLRDPKLSVTPDDRLMVLMGGSIYESDRRVAMAPRVAFAEAVVFSPPQTVALPDAIATEHDWLWRVTWHQGVAWGAVYQALDDGWSLHLVRSDDGLRYRHVTRLDSDALDSDALDSGALDAALRPNETTLRFLPDGRMVALVRCEAGDRAARLGVAAAPYTDWTWTSLGVRIGGPDLLPIVTAADSAPTLLAAGRAYDAGGARTAIWRTTLGGDGSPVTPPAKVLTLPSGGDTSYPGLLATDDGDGLFCSYYSSHLEGRATILLARLRLPRLLD